MFPGSTQTGLTHPGRSPFFELLKCAVFLESTQKLCSSGSNAIESTACTIQDRTETTQKPHRIRTESVQNCKETVQARSVTTHVS